jgi:hypothetical protein
MAQDRCFVIAIAPFALHLTRLAPCEVPQRLGHKHLARFPHVFRLGGALHLRAGCLGWSLAFGVNGATCVDLAHLLPVFNTAAFLFLQHFSHRGKSPSLAQNRVGYLQSVQRSRIWPSVPISRICAGVSFVTNIICCPLGLSCGCLAADTWRALRRPFGLAVWSSLPMSLTHSPLPQVFVRMSDF